MSGSDSIGAKIATTDARRHAAESQIASQSFSERLARPRRPASDARIFPRSAIFCSRTVSGAVGVFRFADFFGAGTRFGATGFRTGRGFDDFRAGMGWIKAQASSLWQAARKLCARGPAR